MIDVGQTEFVGYPFLVAIYDADEDKWDYHYPATIEIIKYKDHTSAGWYHGLAPHYAPMEYDWFGEPWLGELIAKYGKDDGNDDYFQRCSSY